MRVRILDPGETQYGAVNLFAEQLADAYRGLGHSLVAEEADLILSFTTLPKGCSGIQLLVDHPLARHISPGALVGCVDQTHLPIVSRYFDATPFFFPHAGCCLEGPGDPHAHRDIDILFTGSFEDPRCYQPVPCGEPSDLAHARTLFHLHNRHERYSRREAVLRTLADAGLTVDIFGNGWEALPVPHRFHGPVPFREALALYRRAKIVLHICPGFPGGSHERVYSAQMAGAAVATDADQIAALLKEEGRRTAFAAADQAKAFRSHTWMVRTNLVPGVKKKGIPLERGMP